MHQTKTISKQLAALFLALGVLLTVPAVASAQEPAQKFSASDPASKRVVDHSAWQAMLHDYVMAGEDGLNRVDYARFKAKGAQALDRYLEALQRTDVSALNKAEQFAFWANLYNAKTVDIILDHYPVGSIRDIRLSGLFSVGPWKKKVVTVAGVDLSLDDIEHKILRPIWRDPRVHYAVNCAAVGCPNLMRSAFTGAALESQLEKGARAYVNSPRGVTLKGNKIVASKIYRWFADDFGGSAEAVLAHIRRYATGSLAKRLKSVKGIASYTYNWGLNDKI